MVTMDILRAIAISAAILPVAMAATDPVFDSAVTPFLNAHCAACHGGKVKMAGVTVDALREPASVATQTEKWERVLAKMRSGEMPPVGRPKPASSDVAKVTAWIENELDRVVVGSQPDPGRVTAHRLNRAEYNNSVRDLLGVELRPADEFPADDAGYGFDNIADVLSMPPLLTEKYLSAANKIAKAAIMTSVDRMDPTVERFPFDRKANPNVPISDELPFGSRGGVFIAHNFPAEADYVFHIRFRGQQNPDAMAPRLDVRFDGKRVQLTDVRIGQEETDEEKRRTDVRVHVPRGEHTFAATFLRENAKSENADPAQRVGDLGVDFVEVRGPYNPLPPPPPESQKRIFSLCGHTDGPHVDACARKILSSLARRAYRRPATEPEVDRLLRFTAMSKEDGETFEQGIQLALKAMLVSPNFLFRIERDRNPGDPGAAHRIGDFELASRLSYFLWSSLPDDELLALAERNRLREPEVLGAQVKRMLADKKSKALVENFAGQWLQLRNLALLKPDPDKFPAFDVELRAAMTKETELFFEAIVREDRSLLEFLDAKFTFLNERLAKHYGIAGVEGKQFRKVTLDGEQRGGVLTHGSILTISSYPTRTSPVIRGKWILENILGVPPPPPPPGVPELNAAEVGVAGTMRQQLEKHRTNPACSGCHARMDAIGFGLENYDAVGAWRSMDGKFPIDASGTMPGGETFQKPIELKSILKDQKTEFGLCVTGKLLTYALGRGLERYDRPVVRQITRQLEKDGYKFSTLVNEIVGSAPFQMRRAERAKK